MATQEQLEPQSPRWADIRLSRLPDNLVRGVTELVEGGAIDHEVCNGEVWIRAGDINDFLTMGQCIFDEHSSCFIPADAYG